MNFTCNNMLWFMATRANVDNSGMISIISKWMSALIILSGVFAGINSSDALFTLGCAASILFGFILQISHMRRKIILTGKMIVWNAATTLSFSWLAFIFWRAYFNRYDEWLMVYLFICSFMAVVFSSILFSVSRFSFKEILQMVARKLLLDNDKEDK